MKLLLCLTILLSPSLGYSAAKVVASCQCQVNQPIVASPERFPQATTDWVEGVYNRASQEEMAGCEAADLDPSSTACSRIYAYARGNASFECGNRAAGLYPDRMEAKSLGSILAASCEYSIE